MQLIKTIMMEVLPWVPVVALVRIMGNLIRKKRGLGTTPWHEAGAGIFFLYIAAVLNTTVPPVSFLYGLRLQSTVNLIPLHGISVILRQGGYHLPASQYHREYRDVRALRLFYPPAMGQGAALYCRHNRGICPITADRVPAVFYQQGYRYRRFDTQYGRHGDRVSPLCRIPAVVAYVYIEIHPDTAIRHGCEISILSPSVPRYSRLARAGCILARRPLILASFMAWSTSLAWAWGTSTNVYLS